MCKNFADACKRMCNKNTKPGLSGFIRHIDHLSIAFFKILLIVIIIKSRLSLPYAQSPYNPFTATPVFNN
jgi:hypothetical protein